ncbi:MAG: DUF6242 domain-containing protein [Bacteroidaceae bacterium]
MKLKTILAGIALLLTGALLPSCNLDNNDFTAIEPEITNFYFDTIYTQRGDLVTHYKYLFTIDNTSTSSDTTLIYNTDSLPYQSILDSVPITFTTSATVYHKAKDGLYSLLSGKDTLDFRQPQVFYVTGNDEAGNIIQKLYKIQFNTHQIDPDSIPWQSFEPSIQIKGHSRTVLLNNQLYVFTDGGELYTASVSNANSWQKITHSQSFDYTSATVFAGRIYVLAEGKVYASSNGSDWEEQITLNSDANVEALLGANDNYLGAIKGGYFVSTKGSTWMQGASAGSFQRGNAASTTYRLSTNPSIQQVAVLGLHKTGDSEMTLLVAEDDLLNWSEQGPISSLDYCLPYDEDRALIHYGKNKFYAFGTTNSGAFDSYYMSNGLYWEKATNHSMFQKSFNDRQEFSVTVDANNYIWLVFSATDSKPTTIYKGRFNSYYF